MHGRLAHHGWAISRGARIRCSGEPVRCPSIAKGTAGIGHHPWARPAPEGWIELSRKECKGLAPRRETLLPPPSAAPPVIECRRPLYAGPASCVSSRCWSEPLSMLGLSSVSLALVQQASPLATAQSLQFSKASCTHDMRPPPLFQLFCPHTPDACHVRSARHVAADEVRAWLIRTPWRRTGWAGRLPR